MTYNEFIDNILNNRGRFNCGDEYHERHHIVPLSMGGTNKKDNLIDLYAKEHYLAHKLLAKENPNNIKILRAFAAMAFSAVPSHQRYKLTEEELIEAKEMFSFACKEYYKDKTHHPNYGKHLSESTRQKISIGNMGNKKCVGRVISAETRAKIGNANRNPSEETRLRMSIAQLERNIKGDRNPRAKQVIRLSDGELYSCGKYAAEDNNINYTTFKGKVRKHKDFMYYDEYIMLDR